MTTQGPTPPQVTSGIWPAANERGYTIQESPSQTCKHMKVICIGAGFAGVSLADKIRELAPDFELVIYDAADKVGGNWLWNQYPGVACDNAGVTYQFHRKPKTDWTSYYSSGAEILQYLQDYAKDQDLEKHMKLGTRVTKAEWSDENSKWTVSLENLKTGETSQDVGDVLVNAGGTLHHPKYPNLKNQSSFKGIMCHTSRYPTGMDLKGKKVAVLGTGGSGVQILPAIVKDVDHLYHWIRQPTYILPHGPMTAQFDYTKEEKDRFAADPEYYLKYRKALESVANTRFGALFLKGSPESIGFTQYMRADMAARLSTRPEIAKKLIPTEFSFGCRRPTPAPGYLEALCTDKVTVFTEELMEITEKGFKDAQGVEHEIDMFICATGFDTSFKPHFPIISRGENLQDRWNEEPDSYLSYAVPNYPNYFHSFGPYGPTAHGPAVPVIEILAKRFVDLIKHMSTRQILSMVPSASATQDYQEHCKLLLQRAVFTEPCQSWWKKSKDSTPMVFPGSRLAFIEAIEEFRAEDWEYVYEQKNRFRYWGDGRSKRETDGSDVSWYVGLLEGTDGSKEPEHGAQANTNRPLP